MEAGAFCSNGMLSGMRFRPRDSELVRPHQRRSNSGRLSATGTRETHRIDRHLTGLRFAQTSGFSASQTRHQTSDARLHSAVLRLGIADQGIAAICMMRQGA
jgi:hypothetical protein